MRHTATHSRIYNVLQHSAQHMMVDSTYLSSRLLDVGGSVETVAVRDPADDDNLMSLSLGVASFTVAEPVQ